MYHKCKILQRFFLDTEIQNSEKVGMSVRIFSACSAAFDVIDPRSFFFDLVIKVFALTCSAFDNVHMKNRLLIEPKRNIVFIWNWLCYGFALTFGKHCFLGFM